MSCYGMDKLSSEIFSILESKFLFGPDSSSGKIRVLSVDTGGSTDGLLAAISLSRLEFSLRKLSNNPTAVLPDFFDLAAGSGTGGVLVSLIFSRGADNRPLLSASDALRFLSSNHHRFSSPTKPSRSLRRLFKSPAGGGLSNLLSGVFGNRTLKDTVKPVLIPCYDLLTGAPFVFSRADAVESDGYDFKMKDVCAATMGVAAEVRSLDGRTRIDAAVDGGVAVGNPASTAVTHVLNNKTEFPFVGGMEDLMVVSVGNGEAGGCSRRRGAGAAGIVKIAGDGVSDMIDQAVAMAFGPTRQTNYIRIQGREIGPISSKSDKDPASLLKMAEDMLGQRNVESVLFQGKRLTSETNLEKLEMAATELVKEQERRKKSPVAVVTLKQSSPRSSSSSSSPTFSSSSSP